MDQGLSGPAHQHGIEGQDSAGGDHKQPTHRFPVAASRLGRSQQGAATGVATQHHLSHQHRQADDRNDQHVKENETASSALGGPVGESPEIAQTHCTASCRQDKSQPRSPVLLLRCRHDVKTVRWPKFARDWN